MPPARSSRHRRSPARLHAPRRGSGAGRQADPGRLPVARSLGVVDPFAQRLRPSSPAGAGRSRSERVRPQLGLLASTASIVRRGAAPVTPVRHDPVHRRRARGSILRVRTSPSPTGTARARGTRCRASSSALPRPGVGLRNERCPERLGFGAGRASMYPRSQLLHAGPSGPALEGALRSQLRASHVRACRFERPGGAAIRSTPGRRRSIAHGATVRLAARRPAVHAGRVRRAPRRQTRKSARRARSSRTRGGLARLPSHGPPCRRTSSRYLGGWRIDRSTLRVPVDVGTHRAAAGARRCRCPWARWSAAEGAAPSPARHRVVGTFFP